MTWGCACGASDCRECGPLMGYDPDEDSDYNDPEPEAEYDGPDLDLTDAYQ